MVSFELGKEIQRDVFLLVKSVGHRKNSESPRGIQPQTVSIPPPVRSVYVVTFLQFGKRSLPFPCNLSIIATRDLSFRKLPPGGYHLNLNFVRGLTRPDMVNKVFYFEIELKLYILWKKTSSHLEFCSSCSLQLSLAMKGPNFSVISNSVAFCSGYTELNSLDFFNLLVFISFS